MTRALFVLVAGPSGVGKTTVLEMLRRRGHNFHKVITYTTRSPRPGEKHERDYFFLSNKEFEQALKDNKLLENASVFDKSYGVPADQIFDNLKAGRDVFLIADVQGAATIRKKVPEVITIFLKPSSIKDLEKRVKKREVDPEVIKRRLREAKVEIGRASEFSHVLVNKMGEIEKTLDKIEKILSKRRLDAIVK